MAADPGPEIPGYAGETFEEESLENEEDLVEKDIDSNKEEN